MRIFTFLLVLPFITQAGNWDVTPVKAHQNAFRSAYADYPEIPRGLLEAVAYTRTRIRNVQPEEEPLSCLGLPGYYGPMGLVLDGKDWYRSNVEELAALTGLPMEDILYNPASNIRAVAEAMSKLRPVNFVTQEPTDWAPQLLATSELPILSSAGARFVLDTYLYSVFTLMNQPEFQEAYSTPPYQMNVEAFFGANNYSVLSATSLQASEVEVISESGVTYDPSAGSSYFMAGPCYEFPGVSWVEASTTNYSSRAGTAISAVTIHTMQGYYAGTISWFQNPSANVSAHYNMRASDGQITQMVCEADKAWHVGTENPYTVGIEHEGFVSDPSWYTTTVYTVSAALSRNICDDRGILELRTYFKTSTGVLGGCTKVKGHQHYPNQTHTDPGTNWNWAYYYKLVNDPVPTTTYTSSAGTFYDSGGSGGNYGDDERRLYVINPSGSSPVTLTFSSFNLELNWDYIYIYDGTSVYSPLLGVFTGTSSPGSITSSGGAIAVEFRSDCATVSSGWAASWTSSGTSVCATPGGTYTGPVGWTSATVNWNAVSGATEYQVRGHKTGSGGWRSLNTPLTSKWIGIFKEGTSYEWEVRAFCPGIGYSGYSVLNSFTTNTLRTMPDEIALWPNPTSDKLHFAYEGQARISVRNISGVAVWNQQKLFSAAEPVSVDLSNQPAGVYMLTIVSQQGSSGHLVFKR